MIPSLEEGYHVLPMEHISQQSLKYQNRLPSWQKPSQYADSPFQHQIQLYKLGDLQQASIVRNFPDVKVKLEGDVSNQHGVPCSYHGTLDDVYGFTPVAGFEPRSDSRRRIRQHYFDPRISIKPTASFPPFYANYYSFDGQQPDCQRQPPNEGTGGTFSPLTYDEDQYQLEMVNAWNSSTGCRQLQRSLGTVLVPTRCEPGLNHPEDADIDGGSGNTTLSGIYRQNLVPSISYDDDHGNAVVTASSSSSSSLSLTAAYMNVRSETTSSVTSSVASSGRCLRTDVVKTETRKIRLASSTPHGKTNHTNIYKSIGILNRCA